MSSEYFGQHKRRQRIANKWSWGGLLCRVDEAKMKAVWFCFEDFGRQQFEFRNRCE